MVGSKSKYFFMNKKRKRDSQVSSSKTKESQAQPSILSFVTSKKSLTTDHFEESESSCKRRKAILDEYRAVEKAQEVPKFHQDRPSIQSPGDSNDVTAEEKQEVKDPKPTPLEKQV